MAISFSNNIKIQPITYQEFINSEYIPEYGEMVIISDYKQDENGINIPSFTVGDGSTMLKNLKISSEYVENANHSNTADDLGGREETREEQFTFQATAGDESVKDGLAIVKSIKGNTVVANLLLVNNPWLPNFEGKYTLIQEGNLIKFVFDKITETAVAPRFYMPFNGTNRVKGKLYAKIDFAGTHGIQSNTLKGSFVYSCGGYRMDCSPLINNANSISFLWDFSENIDYCFIAADSVENGLIVEPNAELCVRLTVVDLTQMFGEGNEPTIEEFERLYPNLPTEYNEGSLLNLNADSIKSVGFNAFNGEYAKVLGGMQYYLGGNITSLTFKENLEDEGDVIEIPSDKLYIPSNNGYLIATGSDICINLSHSGYRNGEYVLYKESIANLPIKKYFPDGMKSVGDVRDEIVWNSEKYKAIKRVGSVDMGTLRWYYDSGYGGFVSRVSFPSATGKYKIFNGVSAKYPYGGLYSALKDKEMGFIYYEQIFIKDSSYADATSFEQSLQGQILYYELETPIETVIDDYDLIDYEVSDFGTEEILSNEPTTPIVADIQYGFNAVDEIRNHRFEINKLKKGIINDGTLTITQGEEILGEFSANQESNTTIELSKVATTGSYEDLSDKPSLNYLPLSGGTMTGAIDMNKNPLNNAGFEVVTTLPTTNLFVGRKVVMNGVEYTYNGNLWTSQLDPLQKYYNNTDGIYAPLTTLNAKSYEVQLANHQISQIPQLLANNSTSLLDNVLQSNEYVYERMDNGTTEWVETSNRDLYLRDKLRFTAWKDWETNVRGLGSKFPGSINYIGITINNRSYKMKVTIEYLTYTNTLGDADVNNSANYTWWKVYEKEFPYQQNTWIFPLQRTIYPGTTEGGSDGCWYIQNVRITIESITAGTTNSTNFTPYINIYTSDQITPQTVPININYDAKIKPTQNTTTYKTNSWILQYLTQGVNWLRDNKVETNSDASLRTLNIKGGANSTALIESDANSLITRLGGRGSDAQFVIKSNAIRPGSTITNTVELGDTSSYWKSVRAGKYIVHGGTSSQFLKADGSLDSNSYATLDSTGKVPTSQLPSYVDDVEEYTNRASFPATGEKGKIYVDTTENDIYRWTGSTYIKISGIIGAQGEKGAQGYQGIKGTDGANGTNGAQGYQGYQGIKGTDGTRGLQGYQGIKGTDGTNGTNGLQGYQGIKGTDGSRGVQGFQGLQGYKGNTGKNGFNFAGCFISSYSLYHFDQNNIGATYTFNKSDFNISSFDNTNINEGDTILVTYIEENSIGATPFIEHCYIKITHYIVSENTFTGVVLSWFKIHDGEVGLQGYQGYQGLQGTTGLQGKNGADGAQGYRGYQGYTGIQGKQGLQGISGALATNHWYLDKANPEVISINGGSNVIQLNTDSDSIFDKLSTLPNGPLYGRNFIVDWVGTDGNIYDLFGDIHNVPNHVRYHFYIRNMSKGVKIKWNPAFYTNVPHRPEFQPDIGLNGGECCKIEFVKFDDSHAWVDVELEDLIYDASTSAASENNEDNAASQIQAYCENNKLSYTLNKESHDIQFNLIDIIADICSKLK